MANYLEEVRAQYENYPYPMRNPNDEKKRLVIVNGDSLDQLNYYCYEGKETFEGFRVLVAGGGTGDGTIFLAEQFRDKNAEIVHLDMSSASVAMAKKRAETRGLNNITWMQESLLDIPKLDLGEFDLINCIGVLHHLADPDEGFRCIASVLKDSGAMSLMVYGKYGRTGVYQMQELMRFVNDGEENPQEKVENCKKVLSYLPEHNWFKRGESKNDDHITKGDVGIYDLLLHSQDRAYSVPEVYEFVAKQNLHLLDFYERRGLGKFSYSPDSFLKDPVLLEKISAMDIIQQRAISELVSGGTPTHCFYASKQKKRVPSIEDKECVIFLTQYCTGDSSDAYRRVYKAVCDAHGESVRITNQVLFIEFPIEFPKTELTEDVCARIDGVKSIGSIIEEVFEKHKDGAGFSEEQIHDELRVVFAAFSQFDWMFLKHETVPVFKTSTQLQNETLKSVSIGHSPVPTTVLSRLARMPWS
ncbi:MAG: class I SAM-dependent methyltransferase [Verrucomicrobiales bacterium]|jgi:SAM-dependent methyltransferase|nr:class I SAM-dependent methyltransferase [Verrucomicrobiales bacterium]